MKVEMQKQIILDQGVQSPQREPTKLSEKSLNQSMESKTPTLSRSETEELSQAINQLLTLFNLETKVVFHRESNQLVVQVIDAKTNEVIRQIPPEELLEVSRRIHDLIGIFLKTKA